MLQGLLAIIRSTTDFGRRRSRRFVVLMLPKTAKSLAVRSQEQFALTYRMLRRLLHSTVMLVAILVAYQAYVLAMVPWIEPPLVVRPAQAVNPEVDRGCRGVGQQVSAGARGVFSGRPLVADAAAQGDRKRNRLGDVRARRLRASRRRPGRSVALRAVDLSDAAAAIAHAAAGCDRARSTARAPSCNSTRTSARSGARSARSSTASFQARSRSAATCASRGRTTTW